MRKVDLELRQFPGEEKPRLVPVRLRCACDLSKLEIALPVNPRPESYCQFCQIKRPTNSTQP